VPIERKLAKQKMKIEQNAEKEAKAIRKAEASSSIKKATGKTAKGAKPLANGKPQANGIKRESTQELTPAKAKKAARTVKSESAAPAKKGKAKATPVKEETEDPEGAEEEEEEYRWWEDPAKGDGTIKWTTLEHNGVVFPPPYEPLPKNVKMKYNGVPVTLAPEAEEVAGFFGGMLNSTHNVENPTFQNNFFGDFKDILKKSGGAKDPHGKPSATSGLSSNIMTRSGMRRKVFRPPRRRLSRRKKMRQRRLTFSAFGMVASRRWETFVLNLQAFSVDVVSTLRQES
jgi:DNA topoisomerase-1